MAAGRHATAPTSLAATDAERPILFLPAIAISALVGIPLGLASAVIATGPATQVERLLADAVPTRRRESPKHVTPAHQAGREAAQV